MTKKGRRNQIFMTTNSGSYIDSLAQDFGNSLELPKSYTGPSIYRLPVIVKHSIDAQRLLVTAKHRESAQLPAAHHVSDKARENFR